MTWECPNPDCQRQYPDSGLGVPKAASAHEKKGCQVCWESPPGTSSYHPPAEQGGDDR